MLVSLHVHFLGKLLHVFVFVYAAFNLDTVQPDYDLDSEDEVFIIKLKKRMEVGALQFEEMIDRLEKGSGQQVNPAKYWEWNGSAKKKIDC